MRFGRAGWAFGGLGIAPEGGTHPHPLIGVIGRNSAQLSVICLSPACFHHPFVPPSGLVITWLSNDLVALRRTHAFEGSAAGWSCECRWHVPARHHANRA